MYRLDKAGQAVKKASEDLTKAAKDAHEAKDDSQVQSGPNQLIFSLLFGAI